MKKNEQKNLSSINLKSNITLKKYITEKGDLYYLPADLLPPTSIDVRSKNTLTKKQAQEINKLPFLSPRIIDVFEE